MYIKLPETVPHGVHGPVDYLVHDRWLQGLQEQIPSTLRAPAFSVTVMETVA